MQVTLIYVGTTGITDMGALSIRINYPTTCVAGDLLLGCASLKPDTTTITTFSGWTAIANSSATGGTGVQGPDTGPCKQAVFNKISVGGESGSNDFSCSGLNQAVSIMHQFRSTSQSGLYVVAAASGSDNTGGTSWSVTAGQSLTCVPGDMILAAIAHPAPTSAGGWTSDSLTGCGTFATTGAEQYFESTGGNDVVERGRVFVCTDGGSGAPVHTATVPATATNVAGAEVFFQIREIPSQSLVVEQQALNRASLW